MEQSRITSPGWLLKQDNMALINQCRKYIQMEFETRLLFSQPDLIERIREYSRQSHNRKLTELVQDLENRLAVHRNQTSQDTHREPLFSVAGNDHPRPRRIYRGQVIIEA